jgi:hypothetical protein
MGAPAFFGDPRHFDDEGSTRNSLFKAMPHDFISAGKWIEEQQRFYAPRDAKQAKGSTKALRDPE